MYSIDQNLNGPNVFLDQKKIQKRVYIVNTHLKKYLKPIEWLNLVLDIWLNVKKYVFVTYPSYPQLLTSFWKEAINKRTSVGKTFQN